MGCDGGCGARGWSKEGTADRGWRSTLPVRGQGMGLQRQVGGWDGLVGTEGGVKVGDGTVHEKASRRKAWHARES